MSLLAIDIGSSACKAVAFTSAGQILARHASPYTPDLPQPSHAEMDPNLFWNAVCDCTRSLAKNVIEPIVAVCLSSHGETFIPVNHGHQAIGPAILNQDNRAVAEAIWIEQQIGRKRLFEITGLVPHPMYPLPKILWLRQHQPEIFSSTAKFVTVIGYILLRVGLPAYTDYSLACRYLAFDVRKRRWAEDVLDLAGINSDRLPVAVPAGTIVGRLDAASAAQLGLAGGTPVVLGGHDQPCGALGLGVIDQGQTADSMGTYECVLTATNHPVLTDAALSASLNSYCHVVPDKFVTIAFFPSGLMVKWFHDLLYPHSPDNLAHGAEQAEAEHYASLEAQAPPGPTGLCVTPHLIGTCNPDFNPHARAIISGLNLATGRAHLYKGILEGLACEFLLVTEWLAKAVGRIGDIYVTGGGTHSALGLNLRAALAGRRLHMMCCPEAVCLGGAMLAGVAVGEYASFEEAVRRVVREAAVIEPDPAIATAYAHQAKQYKYLRSFLASPSVCASAAHKEDQ